MALFGTAGIRGPVADRLTPALALTVGRAAGLEAEGAAFALGRDGRTTGPALADALAAGLESAGARVSRVGQVPTPALAFASRGRRGAMLTASHNPPADNGIKLFRDGVEYGREREREVAALVEDDPSARPWDEWTGGERAAVLPEYRAAVGAYARGYGAPLEGLSVAVDCGNGVGGLATPAVLRDLGADVTALNANVDGHFPARRSKPTREALADFRAFVAEGGSALGIAHDGDADRIVVLDGEGDIVHEDTVVAVLAERFVRATGGGVVVTTPNASGRIDERVATAGGRTERVRLGALHEGVREARERGDRVAFAAEPWKHLHPGLGGWIDGVASAAVLARLVAEAGLDALREPVAERPYVKGTVECPDDRKPAAMERVRSGLRERFPEAEVETEHGVRLTFPDGAWLLVRPSGTEPCLRLYAESETAEALLADAAEVTGTAVEAA